MNQRIQRIRTRFYILLLMPIFILGSCSKSKEESIPKPIAEFGSGPVQILPGDAVLFLDRSLNSDILEWHFIGGDPEYLRRRSGTLDYGTYIRYDSVGSYPVTLTASNKAGECTITKNNYITVIEDTLPRIYGKVQGINILAEASISITYLNESISIDGDIDDFYSSFIVRLPKKYLGKTVNLNCYYTGYYDSISLESIATSGHTKNIDITITKNKHIEFVRQE